MSGYGMPWEDIEDRLYSLDVNKEELGKLMPEFYDIWWDIHKQRTAALGLTEGRFV